MTSNGMEFGWYVLTLIAAAHDKGNAWPQTHSSHASAAREHDLGGKGWRRGETNGVHIRHRDVRRSRCPALASDMTELGRRRWSSVPRDDVQQDCIDLS